MDTGFSVTVRCAMNTFTSCTSVAQHRDEMIVPACPKRLGWAKGVDFSAMTFWTDEGLGMFGIGIRKEV